MWRDFRSRALAAQASAVQRPVPAVDGRHPRYHAQPSGARVNSHGAAVEGALIGSTSRRRARGRALDRIATYGNTDTEPTFNLPRLRGPYPDEGQPSRRPTCRGGSAPSCSARGRGPGYDGRVRRTPDLVRRRPGDGSIPEPRSLLAFTHPCGGGSASCPVFPRFALAGFQRTRVAPGPDAATDRPFRGFAGPFCAPTRRPTGPCSPDGLPPGVIPGGHGGRVGPPSGGAAGLPQWPDTP